MKTTYFSLFLTLLYFHTSSQSDSTITLTFDFNDHQIKEKDNKVTPRAIGVFLTYDRFGNEKSAIHTQGNAASYISLGVSKLLKSPNMTVSFWVRLDRRNYIGKGNPSNPMFHTKNNDGEDFINAVYIGYDPLSKHVGANSTKDSTHEVVVFENEPFVFQKWYHYVVVCNNSYLALYVDGILNQKTEKNFETKFCETDSMLVGHSGSKKNERMSIGTFDDIQIFHRSLSDKEIKALFEAPNPNKFRNLLHEFLRYGTIILALIGIIVFLIFRNKRALKKQKEQLELRNRISELEIKVIKTQMNPHFISNSMAAIQNLILQTEIDKASQYLAKFSYFLRQILEYSEKNYVSLDEELTIIKLNVELEQLRFKTNFSFHIKIEEGINIAEVLIPSLITHPFIENAIWHGLLPLVDRDPQLRIGVYMKNNAAHIEIVDNGVGRITAHESNGKKSMGTKLARDKIESLNQLRNSSDFKLEIIDLFDAQNRPCGTKVIIRLTTNAY